MVTNIERPVHYRFAHSAENIAVVSGSVAEDSNVPIPRRSQELWHILNLYLHIHPFKVHLTQQLKPADHSQRRRYVEWVLEQQDVNFSNKFSDEAHFTLCGYVNKQNCRIWESRKSYCLVHSLIRRSDWTLFLRKRQWNDCHHQSGALWSRDNRLFCLLLKNTIWRICDFNKTVSHATQLERTWLYCKRHFLAA